MLPAYKFMDSATAVSDPTERVCTFALQTTTARNSANFCVPHQRLHYWSNWPFQDWKFV